MNISSLPLDCPLTVNDRNREPENQGGRAGEKLDRQMKGKVRERKQKKPNRTGLGLYGQPREWNNY